MYITVVHDITDPATFWGIVKEVSQQPLPDGVILHSLLPSRDGARAVCLWQAASESEIRNLVDPIFGHVSKNECYEVDPGNAVGLPA